MVGRTGLGVALAGLLCATPAHARAKDNGRYWSEARGRTARAQHSTIARVARAAMPAVVSITTKDDPNAVGTVESDPAGEPHKGLGSGFIIHPDGYILTCSHVIEGSSEIIASVLEKDGRTHDYKAEVVGQDMETDMALLRIHAGHKLPVLELGTSRNVAVADWVVVIGNPFGLSHSVSVGVVSYKGRTDVVPSGRTGYFDFIQTDASINPGNSGGPILDLAGEVVAIANAVNVAGQGIGFAVPIEMAKQILPQLYAKGSVRRGWMGASVEDLSPEEASRAGVGSSAGVLISEVVDGGPAARAGLAPGDVILNVDRSRVDRAHALRWKVATSGAGRRLELTVSRNGRPMRVKVRLENPPPADEPAGEGLARAATSKPQPQRSNP